jgi:hypothetical protein
VPA